MTFCNAFSTANVLQNLFEKCNKTSHYKLLQKFAIDNQLVIVFDYNFLEVISNKKNRENIIFSRLFVL